MAENESKGLSLEKLITKYSQSASQQSELQKNLPVLSTGVFPIDLALGTQCPYLGNGGIRAKDMMEVMAKNGSGKTALVYASMACVQQRFPEPYQNIVAYFSEPPDDEQFMRMSMMGVDPERIIWIGLESGCGEEVLEQILDLVQYPEIKHTYIDSVAAIPFKADDGKTLEQSQAVCGGAKTYNRFSARYIKTTKFSPLIYTNHYRDPVSSGSPGRPGSTAPPPVTDPNTYGGKTKDFLSKARLMFSANQEYEKENKHSFKWGESYAPTIIEAIKIKVKLVRNKYGPPLRECWITYDFNTFKFNNAETTLRLAATFARKDGQIWKSLLSTPVYQSGAYWTIGTDKFQGIEKAEAFLEANPELMLELQRDIIPHSKNFWLDNVSFDEDEIDK